MHVWKYSSYHLVGIISLNSSFRPVCLLERPSISRIINVQVLKNASSILMATLARFFVRMQRIHGPQTQSVKSNSSILAYLNVIKTTFLIFSCTKHLHNSFCIHFDAFWCILMHSEHLEKNWSISTKKNGFFQIKISYTKLKNNSFCIHFNAFWCIQMHFDAFYPNQI